MKTCKMFSCPVYSALLTVSAIRNKALFRSALDKVFVKKLLYHGSRLLTRLKQLENKVTTFVTVNVFVVGSKLPSSNCQFSTTMRTYTLTSVVTLFSSSFKKVRSLLP